MIEARLACPPHSSGYQFSQRRFRRCAPQKGMRKQLAGGAPLLRVNDKHIAQEVKEMVRHLSGQATQRG